MAAHPILIERETVAEQLRQIVINGLVVRAKSRGVEHDIKVYRDNVLFLQHLKDVATQLGLYGEAVYNSTFVEYLMNSTPDRLPPPETLPITEVDYQQLGQVIRKVFLLEAGDTYTTYKRLNWWLLQKYVKTLGVSPSLCWQLLRGLLLPGVRHRRKAHFLIYFSELLKTTGFYTSVLLPIKNNVLSAIDELTRQIGAGVFVRPSTETLRGNPQISDFIGVSTVMNHVKDLPAEAYCEAQPLVARLAELDKQWADEQDAQETRHDIC